MHQESRASARRQRASGVTKVPDARLDALAKLFEPPKITHATVEYLDFPAISKEALRDPSYLASLRVADAFAHVLRAVRRRDRAARERLGRSAARSRRRRDGAGAERSGGGREAPRAAREGSQEDQESGARPRVRAARKMQSDARSRTSRCASSSSTPTTRNASAAFSSFRRSRCSTC